MGANDHDPALTSGQRDADIMCRFTHECTYGSVEAGAQPEAAGVAGTTGAPAAQGYTMQWLILPESRRLSRPGCSGRRHKGVAPPGRAVAVLVAGCDVCGSLSRSARSTSSRAGCAGGHPCCFRTLLLQPGVQRIHRSACWRACPFLPTRSKGIRLEWGNRRTCFPYVTYAMHLPSPCVCLQARRLQQNQCKWFARAGSQTSDCTGTPALGTATRVQVAYFIQYRFPTMV